MGFIISTFTVLSVLFLVSIGAYVKVYQIKRREVGHE